MTRLDCVTEKNLSANGEQERDRPGTHQELEQARGLGIIPVCPSLLGFLGLLFTKG